MGDGTRILYSFAVSSRCLQSDGAGEVIERVGDALVEAVQLRELLRRNLGLGEERSQEPGGKRSVEAVEELEEDHAEAVARGEQPIPPRMRKLFDQPLGAQLGNIVAQRREPVVAGGLAQGSGDWLVKLGHVEGAAGSDVCEPDQGLHDGKLARMIELQARNAFAARQDGRLAQLLQLAVIDKGLQDVLLDVQVGVDDRGLLLAKGGEMVDRLRDCVVPNVVGGRLGAQQQMITHVLLDEPMTIVAADHGVRQMAIVNHRLQVSAVAAGDLAAEDHGELVWLPDCAVGVEQAGAEVIERRAPVKDQIVAVLDLREEQAVPTASLGPLSRGKEGGEAGEPLLCTARDVSRGQGVGEFLKPLRGAAAQERIATLLEVDAVGAEPIGQPVVLVEVYPRREGEVRADPHEHPAPGAVVDVEVVLDDQRCANWRCQRLSRLLPMAISRRPGSRALRMATTASGSARWKYRSMNSSRRSSGASRTGTPQACARFLTQLWHWLAMSRRVSRLTSW